MASGGSSAASAASAPTVGVAIVNPPASNFRTTLPIITTGGSATQKEVPKQFQLKFEGIEANPPPPTPAAQQVNSVGGTNVPKQFQLQFRDIPANPAEVQTVGVAISPRSTQPPFALKQQIAPPQTIGADYSKGTPLDIQTAKKEGGVLGVYQAVGLYPKPGEIIPVAGSIEYPEAAGFIYPVARAGVKSILEIKTPKFFSAEAKINPDIALASDSSIMGTFSYRAAQKPINFLGFAQKQNIVGEGTFVAKPTGEVSSFASGRILTQKSTPLGGARITSAQITSESSLVPKTGDLFARGKYPSGTVYERINPNLMQGEFTSVSTTGKAQITTKGVIGDIAKMDYSGTQQITSLGVMRGDTGGITKGLIKTEIPQLRVIVPKTEILPPQGAKTPLVFGRPQNIPTSTAGPATDLPVISAPGKPAQLMQAKTYDLTAYDKPISQSVLSTISSQISLPKTIATPKLILPTAQIQGTSFMQPTPTTTKTIATPKMRLKQITGIEFAPAKMGASVLQIQKPRVFTPPSTPTATILTPKIGTPTGQKITLIEEPAIPINPVTTKITFPSFNLPPTLAGAGFPALDFGFGGGKGKKRKGKGRLLDLFTVSTKIDF